VGTSYSLRQLTEADIDAVYLVRLRGNEDVARDEPLLAAPVPPTAQGEFREELRAELQDADHRHLVAEEGGKCLGWGHGYVVLDPDGLRIGYVSAIYVDHGARRRGIGSALLTSLVEWLDGMDVERVQLVTASRSYAQRLWLKRGFRTFLETMVLEREPV
jgi:ribosomal protein S18 acetylase RimI-like enzyme